MPEDIQLWRSPDGTAQASIPHTIQEHSPTGFEWGYSGSGPADLALNILAEFMPTRKARDLHQLYKRDVIAKLDRDSNHTIKAVDVQSWIDDHKDFWRLV